MNLPFRQSFFPSLFPPYHWLLFLLSSFLGLAFHYFITQLPFWWTCHVIAVFLNTLFPYQMRRMECSKRLRCLHVFMVAAGILLPMASMATVTAHGSYILGRVPTFLCVGRNRHIVFSVTVVPITIAIGVGSTLMIFIISTVIKVRLIISVQFYISTCI